METEISPSVGIPDNSLDFSFGFGDPNYSDRTLSLHYLDDTHPNPINATTAPRVKTIHICSLILAARSPVFGKMFSNGMRESEEKNVTVRIKTSEEVSFVNLLKYVYSNNLPTALNALLDLSVMADKYEPLIYAAKEFLVSYFKDFDACDKFQEEMLKLPLAGIQAVLSSDDLQVNSEFEVFNIVLEWVHNHYPNLEERRMMLKTHLLHLVRFPFMTTTELTDEVQTCDDIDPAVALKIVISALCFKAETPYQKRCLTAEKVNTGSRQFVERAYKFRPVKVVELELPHQQCIIYLHFTREKLIRIFEVGQMISETFHLGEEGFVLFGTCGFLQNSNIPHFLLALEMQGSSTCKVNYEIQLRMKPHEEFSRWAKGSHTFTDSADTVYLRGGPWTEFLGDDSPYFINDILHVRAELLLRND